MHIGDNAAQFSALGESIRQLAGTASADCLPSIIDDLSHLMTDQTTIIINP